MFFKYQSLIGINMLPLFNFNSCFHLVVDVLVELNKLNKKIQFDMVSISTIGCTFNASISILKICFLCNFNLFFCQLIKHLGPFLFGRWVDAALRWRAPNGLEGLYHPMHHGSTFYAKDSLEKCMNMGANYVQAIVDSLNDRFLDLLVFNEFKLFNPNEEKRCINMCE